MSRTALLTGLGVAAAAAVAALLLIDPLGADEARAAEKAKSGAGGAAAGPDLLASSVAEGVRGTGLADPKSEPVASAPAGQSAEEALASPLVLRGTVVDSDRRPVAGAEVTLTRAYSSTGAISVTGSTDEKGRFLLGAPERSGWGWRIEARASGYAPSFLNDPPTWIAQGDVGPIVLRPAVTLQGRVVDRDNHAVPGALVFLFTVPIAVDQDDLTEDTGEHKPMATSGADGAFAIASLSAGKVTIGAQAPGYADAVRPGARLRTDKPNFVELTMLPEEPLTGTVVDDAGRAVAKARVAAHHQGNGRAAFWRRPIESDADGKFRVPGLDRSRRSLELQLSKVGYGMLWLSGSHLPADERYVLPKATLITLRAEGDASHAPPAIRAVRFERRARAGARWGGWNEVAKTQREVLEPHVWRVTTQMSGTLRAVVTAVDGSVGRSNEFESTGIPSSGIEMAVTFEAAGVLAGRVVRGDATPVAGVRVELMGGDPQRGQTSVKIATSGADGSFSFAGVPSGKATLSVRADDWVSAPTSTDVLAGETRTGLEVVVSKPSRVRGKLTIGGAPPGEPIALALHRVELHENGANWRMVALGSTNADGEFSVSPVPSGRVAVVPKKRLDLEDGVIRSFQSEMPHPEWDDRQATSWPWMVDVPPEGEASIEINLPVPRPSVVRGKVTVNGEARSGLDVWIQGNEGNDWQSDTTDAEGKFRFKIEKVGAYRVQLYGDGFHENKKVTVSEGDDQELNFDLTAGGVEGSVADRSSGQAVVMNARLERIVDKRNREEDGGWYWYDSPEVQTKADGSYAFPEATAGNYRVVVTDGRGRLATMASAQFTVGPRERYQVPQIRVPLSVPLVVTVKDSEGKPVQGRVTVTAAPGTEPLARKQSTAWIGKTGSVRIRALPPGSVVVKIKPNGPWQAAEQTAVLPDGGGEVRVVFEAKKREGNEGTAVEAAAQMLVNSEGEESEMDWDFSDFEEVMTTIGYVGGK